MNPFILAILLSALGLGTAITLTSSHWLIAWVGLELNTVAILALMTRQAHPWAVEALTKYFLIQAAAGATLLFAATTNAWITGQWGIHQMTHPIQAAIATLALAMKVGLAPTHFWLPEVLQGLDLTTGLILSTWQKLAPFALLLQLPQHNPTMLIMLGLSSTLIGGWGGLNQTKLRKILAYSSIAHFGWMMLVMQYSPSLSILTLSLYILMTASTFLTFKLAKATSINQLAASSFKYPALTALTPLTLLSLAGLPPLTGFMPKWLIVQELTKQSLSPTATLAIMSALLSLYFYLRLSYAMTLTSPPNTIAGTTPWRLHSSTLSLPLATSITATLLLLPMTPALLSLVTP
uniref:NADH-ubiquinone oxidoreductase chain 2 n=1 Tax=Pempheris vanicolensis TaxID=512326 RepID=B9TUY9_9TELE|nr:NADH dehydrogenase subunit 2 [Pempheris vanicolensis]